MNISDNQKALAVWTHFEAICAIPHGSGNEAALASFIEAFAHKRGLPCVRDHANNVFVTREATPGYEDKPSVLLQGHLDMVCEMTDGAKHDFSCDGLTLFVEDGWLGAKDTTLGGDDGIAVAYMLALLDGAASAHPRLECLFTVSEETGLEGAHAFDPVAAGVTATYMINLDSEEENVITAGCAGGVRTDIHLPLVQASTSQKTVRVHVSGLSGGHSGTEITGGHTNAIKFLSRLLLTAFEATDHGFGLVSINGGGKDNAIPRSATAVLACDDPALPTLLCNLAEEARQDPVLIAADRHFEFEAVLCDKPSPKATSAQDTKKVLDLLTTARDGVLAMSEELVGFPVYSRNLGILCTEADRLVLSFSSRSPSDALLDASENELSTLAADFGGTARHYARYPGWDFAPTSHLRSVWTQIYTAQTGLPILVETIHAGLECGILRHKMPHLDVISVGPTMRAIHTPAERLHIQSAERIFDVLQKVLAQL